MQQAQGAQCLDQMQLSGIEIIKAFIAFQQLCQLQVHLLLTARKQHPEILHRRACAAIIKIDKMRAIVSP